MLVNYVKILKNELLLFLNVDHDAVTAFKKMLADL